jgi:CubicO group peptidase (beta-lactamase class C family)
LRFLVFFDMDPNAIAGWLLRHAGCTRLPDRPGHCQGPAHQYGACMDIHGTEIHGTQTERFEQVRATFEQNFTQRGDVGASVCVTVDGETMVDLWAGSVTTDAQTETPWAADTIINVWSTTKTMAAICCLILADQGELDLHAPVERVWPGFRVNGKHEVAPRHVLSHSAGLSGWDTPLEIEDLLDHGKVTHLLAAQEPWWEPGTASGYHAITQGYLLGELVRRVTGQTIGEFFAAEVAGPLGADFHIGTPAEHDARVAHVIPPDAPLGGTETAADSIAIRSLGNPRLPAEFSSSTQWRRAEIPAAGGHGNARSVARIHSVLACGGAAHGVKLLSSAGCEQIFEEQTYGQDLVLPMVLRHGMGFGLNCPEVPISPNPRACYWGGWGGSMAVIDLDARMSFAYVMNKMGDGTTGDTRGASLLLATHAALTA